MFRIVLLMMFLLVLTQLQGCETRADRIAKLRHLMESTGRLEEFEKMERQAQLNSQRERQEQTRQRAQENARIQQQQAEQQALATQVRSAVILSNTGNQLVLPSASQTSNTATQKTKKNTVQQDDSNWCGNLNKAPVTNRSKGNACIE